MSKQVYRRAAASITKLGDQREAPYLIDYEQEPVDGVSNVFIKVIRTRNVVQ